MRVRVTVLSPQVRPSRPGIGIAVFHEFTGRLNPSGAQVEDDKWFYIRYPAPLDELVQAELIGLKSLPGRLQPRST